MHSAAHGKSRIEHRSLLRSPQCRMQPSSLCEKGLPWWALQSSPQGPHLPCRLARSSLQVPLWRIAGMSSVPVPPRKKKNKQDRYRKSCFWTPLERQRPENLGIVEFFYKGVRINPPPHKHVVSFLPGNSKRAKSTGESLPRVSQAAWQTSRLGSSSIVSSWDECSASSSWGSPAKVFTALARTESDESFSIVKSSEACLAKWSGRTFFKVSRAAQRTSQLCTLSMFTSFEQCSDKWLGWSRAKALRAVKRSDSQGLSSICRTSEECVTKQSAGISRKASRAAQRTRYCEILWIFQQLHDFQTVLRQTMSRKFTAGL